MEEFLFVRQCDLNLKAEKDIISIKEQHWDYSFDSQREWMLNNLKKEDLHLLLYVNGRTTAYLNLANITVSFNDKEFTAVGLGNVCVAKSKTGYGYGRKIILKANEIIENTGKIGFLLCNEKLTNFYCKMGWRKMACNNILVAGKFYDKKIMSFNAPIGDVQKLEIDRNF